MSEVKNINWEVMVEKASSYQGTIRDFCKENNIQERKFYYHRRRMTNTNKVIFQMCIRDRLYIEFRLLFSKL